MSAPNPFLVARAALVETIERGRAEGWVISSAAGLALDAPTSNGAPNAMEVLRARLALADTDVSILWLLAAIELDAVAASAARCLIHAGSESLSLHMVEQVVTGGRGSLDPSTFERLARWMLVEIARPDLPMPRRSVRVHDRVLDLARGYLALDRSLGADAALAVAIQTNDPKLDPRLCRALQGQAPILAIATGRPGSGRCSMFARSAGGAGLGAIRVRCDDASTHEELVRRARVLRRECVLHHSVPIFREVDQLGDRFAILDRELADLPLPVLATAREHYAVASRRSSLVVEIRRSTERERESAWQRSLGTEDVELVQTCASRYSLTPGQIAKTAAAARSLDPQVKLETVQTALRGAAQAKLGDLAQRIETKQTWNDLVLPDDQYNLLSELVARVRQRGRVLEDWDFAAKIGRGCGLAVLLSGPPGTGKTMIAGLVAKELGVDLYQIDLARVVSKYIGDTEKQLSALFDAAEDGNAMLLFDEADALLGKRTEVKSSNDRYANLEVNYLLQRIEAFTGIAVMTTNHEASIDPALLRRLAFHVRVPMPEVDERASLWRAMLPAAAPVTGEIDFEALAHRFVMSGGHIKNAVVRAAYLSADAGTAITAATLWHGARVEYEAMGKVTGV